MSSTASVPHRTSLATPLADELTALLTDARERTLLLIAPLSDEELTRQHDTLMSPIIWDLGHIATFEELWLLRQLDAPVTFGEMPGLYNPFEHPRRERGSLELPSREETLGHLARVRAMVVERLRNGALDRSELTRDGYVYRMVAQHEHQHNETMLQTLQLKSGGPYHPAARRYPPIAQAPAVPGGMVSFAGGTVTVGTDDRTAAYDNERPRHQCRVSPFSIDAAPVTNGEYLAFIEAGGYRNAEWWTDAGRRWLDESGAEAPKYWRRERGEWWRRAMDRDERVPLEHPVVHVCYFEAEAYARWAGKRLPTEIEWEVAATWDPALGRARLFPWGDEPATARHANLDQLAFGTAPVGAYPLNVSPLGCYGMVGDVWEWTSSDFAPYAGFQAFPYREYSEVFFGSEYKVLRGGSWATRPLVARSTFRNWDYPMRRQIFSGFRCAA